MAPQPAFRSRMLASSAPGRFIADEHMHVSIEQLRHASTGHAPVGDMQGKTVLLATERQLPTVMAALTLDGCAKRIYFCPPELHSRLDEVCSLAEVDVVVTNRARSLPGTPEVVLEHAFGGQAAAHGTAHTEWVLFTSGTTGVPKMVVHDLASLSGPLHDGVSVAEGAVWSTFYDIRRYGGMQILLRALLGGGSLVLSGFDEPTGAFLQRAQANAVSHVSGTPSHWRRALMCGEASRFTPRYVRLSGETADQMILDRLRSAFPQANIAHAYASTEAGVGFDVRDGRPGFPVAFVPYPESHPGIELKIESGTLHVRSTRVASRYLGSHELPMRDGFIDTGDLIERNGERYHFVGRREGVINVGGHKVFPEEVESLLTRHPDVLAARVWSRKNPITGALVAADLMLQPTAQTRLPAIIQSLEARCRQRLAPFKVPVTWRSVEAIEMTAAGKVRRA